MAQYFFLKQKGTGHIYMKTDLLAARDDMEAYTPPEEGKPSGNQQVQVDANDPANSKDWRKITKKSDLADFAHINDGIELNQERTLVNMRAQYIAALQARENGEDGQAAADAMAAQAE